MGQLPHMGGGVIAQIMPPPWGDVNPADAATAIDLFDERGRHELVLSIGHQTSPVDKRHQRIKFRVWVQTESVAVVANCVFAVIDGTMARAERVAQPPWEVERTTACANEAVEVEVTIHYHPWTNAPPTRHNHQVMLRPAGRGRTEEKFVVLDDPKRLPPPIAWNEYEARPGHYLHRPQGSQASRGAWSSGGPGDYCKSAPQLADRQQFPVLGGKEPSLARNHSFASALLGGTADSSRREPSIHRSALQRLASAPAGSSPSCQTPPATVVDALLTPPQARSSPHTSEKPSADSSFGSSPAPPVDMSGAAPADGTDDSLAWLASVAIGDVSTVGRWLGAVGLKCYRKPFAHHLVDGATLCRLTELELERDFGVVRGKHRLLKEIERLRLAAPPPPETPPAIRRQPSDPPRGYHLVDVHDPLENKLIRQHLACSQMRLDGHTLLDDADGALQAPLLPPKVLQLQRAQRVINPYLDRMLGRTNRALIQPDSHRGVPPQGGYWYGTNDVLSICEHGFDDSQWVDGKYGKGAVLSMDAAGVAQALGAKGTSSMLLCEVALGCTWHLRKHECQHGLDMEKAHAAGYDSIAVPDSDLVVVYRRFQAIPRYIVHFHWRTIRPPPPPPPSTPFRAISFCGGRFEQRLFDRSEAEFGEHCTRAAAVEVATKRPVFLKLVEEREAAEREADALRKVGRSFAPELIHTFTLDGCGTVLVLEAALVDSSLLTLCRRADSREGSCRRDSSSKEAANANSWAAVSSLGGNGVIGDRDRSKFILVEAHQVLQCVKRVHEVGLVHCECVHRI